MLERETTSIAHEAPRLYRPTSPDLNNGATVQDERNFVLFNKDLMFRHNVARFNYTTYDVRRSQDVINPRTSHHNIMVLADYSDADCMSHHPFWYAQVLRIYHVNVVYTGPGTLDYRSRRFDFLWVRWYRNIANAPTARSWETYKLDCIRFPPMGDDDAFGFVDPADVLRSSYIAPSFSSGLLRSDGVSLSRCAQDSKDWGRYYVCRYVQRCRSV
jgi:hypothetical protein